MRVDIIHLKWITNCDAFANWQNLLEIAEIYSSGTYNIEMYLPSSTLAWYLVQ